MAGKVSGDILSGGWEEVRESALKMPEGGWAEGKSQAGSDCKALLVMFGELPGGQGGWNAVS